MRALSWVLAFSEGVSHRHRGDVSETVRPGWYAFPWPDEIVGVGRRMTKHLERCAYCTADTWVAYGGLPLCLPCAVGGGRPRA
jgi:hypothetical protein